MGGGKNPGDVDIAGVFVNSGGVELHEAERLKFANRILAALFLICVGVFAGYAYAPDNKAMGQIFDLVKVGVLPVVTLVISFYFPSASRK